MKQVKNTWVAGTIMKTMKWERDFLISFIQKVMALILIVLNNNIHYFIDYTKKITEICNSNFWSKIILIFFNSLRINLSFLNI